MIFGNELTRLSADPNILRSYAAPDARQSAWQILEADLRESTDSQTSCLACEKVKYMSRIIQIYRTESFIMLVRHGVHTCVVVRLTNKDL